MVLIFLSHPIEYFQNDNLLYDKKKPLEIEKFLQYIVKQKIDIRAN